jgi:iron(III) transport system permease protein
MAMPSLLLAVGWVLLTSREIGAITNLLALLLGESARQLNIYSLGGMIFVQGLAGVPLAFLIFAPAMRSMNPAFEEAALMSGARFATVFRRISLPFLVPSILSVFTLQVIVSLLAFDVPAILGLPGNIPVISAEIYNLMNPTSGLPDYGATAAVNASMLAPIALMLGIYYYSTRKAFQFATVSGKGYRATRFQLGRWKALGFVFVAVYFLCAVALPFLAVLWVSLTPYFAGFQIGLLSKLSFAAYAGLLSNGDFWKSAFNSVVIAGVVSMAEIALAVLVGWCVLRSGSVWSRVVDILAMAPMSVPHLMMGVSLIFIFFTLRFIPIYGTIWIIALGHLVVYMPQACRMMQVAMLQVHHELEESATVCGASMAQRLRRIVIPLVAPMIGAIFLWVFMHSIREFSIAVTLRSGQNEVLSTMLFSYWDNGRPQSAAAMAVILMLTLAALVGVSRMRRFGAHGV